MVVPMGTIPDKHPAPFVTLENGTTVESKTVTAKGRKIKTDKTSYKADEVAAYSDGKSTYANIKGRAFAPRIYEGDFNVYQTTSSHTTNDFVGRSAANPGGWHSSSHTHVRTYVQKAGTPDLRFLNYATLRSMISPKEPAFQYLKVYKAHRRIDNAIMAGGLVMFVAGAAILGSSVMSTTGKGETAGAVIMIAGPAAMLTGFFMKGFNLLNLKRAVAKHNGITVK